jgi:hypothetical protein
MIVMRHISGHFAAETLGAGIDVGIATQKLTKSGETHGSSRFNATNNQQPTTMENIKQLSNGRIS